MTKVAIGQYYPAKSAIHSLDPRVKLGAALLYIILLFLAGNVWGYLFAAGCLGLVIYASKVPAGFIVRGLRGILFIMLFTVVLNIFFTPGESVLFSYWFITVSVEGLVSAAKLASRLVMLVTGSSLLTLTTSPIQLTDAIEYYLKPFKKIGVPAHEIAMTLTIALRFIPTLMEEVEKTMKAQSARGADFDTGGLIRKAKALIPLLVPLFVSAIRRADELAMAMEARCYRGDYNRTKMKHLKLTRKDYAGIACVAVFCAGIILSRFL